MGIDSLNHGAILFAGLVPTKYKENLSLGRWVSAQRKKYRNLQANLGKALTPEKVQQLEEIGFVWCATTDLKPE